MCVQFFVQGTVAPLTKPPTDDINYSVLGNLTEKTLRVTEPQKQRFCVARDLPFAKLFMNARMKRVIRGSTIRALSGMGHMYADLVSVPCR